MDETVAAVRFVELCAAADLWTGEMRAFKVGPHQIRLVNVDGTFHAYDGICPYQRVTLAEGRLDGHTLVCWATSGSLTSAPGAA